MSNLPDISVPTRLSQVANIYCLLTPPNVKSLRVASLQLCFLLSAPLLISGVIHFGFIAECSASMEPGFPSKFLAGIMAAIVSSAGLERAAAVWKSSRTNVEVFVPKEEVQSFVESNVSCDDNF